MQVHPVQAHPIRKLLQQQPVTARVRAAVPARTIPRAPLTVWQHFFFGFDGRISREDFWCGALGLLAALMAISLLVSYLPVLVHDFIMGIAYTAVIYPVAALMAKRLQDRGKGPFYLYLFLGLPVAFSIFNLFGPDPSNPLALAMSALYVPVTLWALIELCFLQGTSGANTFGGAPEVTG